MKFIVHKRKSWYALFNLFVLLLIPIVALTGLILLSIKSHSSLLDPIAFIIIFLLSWFGFYILNYIFWQFRGYEEIEFNEKELVIWRRGKLKSDKLRIPISSIQTIQEQDYKPINYGERIFRNPFLFSKLIGETGGRILVRYGKRIKYKVDFGLGLTPKEAKLYVEQMNEILDIVKSNLENSPKEERFNILKYKYLLLSLSLLILIIFLMIFWW